MSRPPDLFDTLPTELLRVATLYDHDGHEGLLCSWVDQVSEAAGGDEAEAGRLILRAGREAAARVAVCALAAQRAHLRRERPSPVGTSD